MELETMTMGLFMGQLNSCNAILCRTGPRKSFRGLVQKKEEKEEKREKQK
ncbi:hypothetical protein [uncultured Dysosmobacter sp.]|nr:hypothetical protein [uncultured Dysosmobacter sp.]